MWRACARGRTPAARSLVASRRPVCTSEVRATSQKLRQKRDMDPAGCRTRGPPTSYATGDRSGASPTESTRQARALGYVPQSRSRAPARGLNVAAKSPTISVMIRSTRVLPGIARRGAVELGTGIGDERSNACSAMRSGGRVVIGFADESAAAELSHVVSSRVTSPTSGNTLRDASG